MRWISWTTTVLLALCCHLWPSSLLAELNIVDCYHDTSCMVKTFRADAPVILAQHNISGTSQVPVPPDDTVIITYEGVDQDIVCDDTWQNIASASGLAELQNSVKCTIGEDRNRIVVDLILFDQETFNYPYEHRPSETGYPELTGTSPVAPYCDTETDPDTAEACKWETFNGEQWVVFARTTVTDLVLGFEVPEGTPAQTPESMCGEDIDGDGQLEPNEFGPCIDTPQGNLCLVDAVLCAAATSDPICPPGGDLNPSSDRCEDQPTETCPDPNYVFDTMLGTCIDITQCADICPPGYTYNPVEYRCQGSPCEAPATYNPATDRCEIAASFSCPVNGQDYADQFLCEQECQNVGSCVQSQINNACFVAYAPEGGYQGPWADSFELMSQWAASLNNTPCNYLDQNRYELCYNIDFPCGWNRGDCGLAYEPHDSAFWGWPDGYYYPVPFGDSPLSGALPCLPEMEDYFNSYAPIEMPYGGTVPGYTQDGRPYVACNIASYCPIFPIGVKFNEWAIALKVWFADPVDFSCSLNGQTYTDKGACIAACSQTIACLSDCPQDYTVSGSLCIKNPICSFGGIINPVTGFCELDPDFTSPGCTIDPDQNCDPGYAYVPASGLCEAVPICAAGAYDAATDLCVSGQMVCPYDPGRTCMAYMGQMQCSPYDCVVTDGNVIHLGTVEGSGDKQDDGQIDSATGECLGQIYIFNGRDRRCRTDGVTTGFDNCCKTDKYLFDLYDCTAQEIELAAAKSNDLCHYVGKYCSQELDLTVTTVCIEHKKTYCCFSSKLGRIIEEQARKQMTNLDWGSPESPHCRGLTPEEFQMLDHSKLDLSEFYGDIETKSQQTLSSEIQSTTNTTIVNSQGGSLQ